MVSRIDPLAGLMRRIEELERKTNNHHRMGTVKKVDHDKGKVIITDGVWTSGWLDWREHNSNGGLKTRSMPTEGAQAEVRTWSGLEKGTVSHSAYPTDTNKLPKASDGEHVTQMGADSDDNGKPQGDQVKHVTTAGGKHRVGATTNHTVTVGAEYTDSENGDYTHSIDKEKGHVFGAGKDVTVSFHKKDGVTIKAGKTKITLTKDGVLVDGQTAFTKVYGKGNSPGNVTTPYPSESPATDKGSGGASSSPSAASDPSDASYSSSSSSSGSSSSSSSSGSSSSSSGSYLSYAPQ